MSSYMNLAYVALKAAGVAGNTGTLERRVVDGLVELGTFGGASVGALDGNGPPLRQLQRAMDPAPTRSGSPFRVLVGGGPRQFLAAVKAAIPPEEE